MNGFCVYIGTIINCCHNHVYNFSPTVVFIFHRSLSLTLVCLWVDPNQLCVARERSGYYLLSTSFVTCGNSSIVGSFLTLLFLFILDHPVLTHLTCIFIRSHPTCIFIRSHPTCIFIRPHPTCIFLRPRQTCFVFRPHPTRIFINPRSTCIFIRSFQTVILIRPRPNCIFIRPHPCNLYPHPDLKVKISSCLSSFRIFI